MHHLPACRFLLINSRSDSSSGSTLAWSYSFDPSAVILKPEHAVKHAARIKIPLEEYMNYFEVSPPTIIEFSNLFLILCISYYKLETINESTKVTYRVHRIGCSRYFLSS